MAEKEQAAEVPRKAPSVAGLVDEYLTKHAMANKKSWKEDKRCLEKDVLPLWGTRKAGDIKKRDVVLLLEGIVERGSPITANNTLEKIRKMFNFAVERDILEFTPCYGGGGHLRGNFFNAARKSTGATKAKAFPCFRLRSSGVFSLERFRRSVRAVW